MFFIYTAFLDNYSVAPTKQSPKFADPIKAVAFAESIKGAIYESIVEHQTFSGHLFRCNSFYMAGNQDSTDGLEQVQIGEHYKVIAGGVPSDLWQLNFAKVNVANYDLGVTYPADANGHTRVFLPLLTYSVDASTKALSNFKLKFAVWDADKSAYVTLTDLGAARAMIDSIGISISTASGSDSARFLFNPNKDYTQGDEGWTITDKAGEISLPAPIKATDGSAVTVTLGGGANDVSSIFIYYRAGGNSYDFSLN